MVFGFYRDPSRDERARLPFDADTFPNNPGELQDLERRLSTATGDDIVTYGKMVQIQEIYLDALLKIAILAAAQHRIIDEFISELIRKKLKEATCLCFRIGRDRRIEVVFRAGANDWLMLDGRTVTPCSYHLLAGSKWSRALNELESLVNSTLSLSR